MTVFPAGRTVVDREQVRRDAIRLLSEIAVEDTLALQRHCLALLAELEQAEKESTEHFRRSMRLGHELSRLWPLAQEQAKEEWRSNAVDKIPALEARLARVPALVEAAKQVVTAGDAMENGGRGVLASRRGHLAMVKAEGELLLAEALAEWEQA